MKFLSNHAHKISNLAVFAIIFAFLASYFNPGLILLDTVTSGGDTGSHNYSLWYLDSELIKSGRLSGWSPDWYAGFPIFQFYFVLPFLIMEVLSAVFPLFVSFKIVSVLGTFLLPVAAFISMKMMGQKFPAPILAALLTLPFLFMEANSMWGGNIPSTLAGEFSYSLSLAFTVLFMGALHRSFKSRSIGMIVCASVIFSLALLCHIYTAIFAVASSLFFIIVKDRKELLGRILHFIKVYGLAFLLTAFWAVPLLAKMQYATAYHYVWSLGSILDVLPAIILPFVLLAAAGAYEGLRKRDNVTAYLLFAMLTSLILYMFGPVAGLTDIRFVPMLQLFPMFIASCFLANILKSFRFSWIVVLAISLIVIFWVSSNVSYIDFWIKWNYEGFQSKPHWSELESMMFYLSSLPDGRVVHEYSSSHDMYGTPRTLENTPLFSGKPTLEGLNIESALSAPYVFVIQAEISQTSTCPIPNMRCGSFNITMAERHLEMFNIRYIVATSEKLKVAIEEQTEWPLLEEFGPLSVYKVGNQNYVEVPEYMPMIFEKKGSDWKELSLEWFKNESVIDVPIIFVDEGDKLPEISAKKIDSLDDVEKVPLNANCNVRSERISNSEISIDTDCIGQPIVVKMSYFPNWQVEGADKVYLTSPSFMMIFPKQENVRLYYGYTDVDYASYALTAAGIFTLISLAVFRKVEFKHVCKHLRRIANSK